MADNLTAEKELNALIASGRIVEGFERYYHDDVQMQENLADPMKGKAANLDRERAFWGSAKVNSIALLGSAAAGDRTYSEWSFDVVLANGFNLKMTEVAARQWKDGKVISERFYYDPKAGG